MPSSKTGDRDTAPDLYLDTSALVNLYVEEEEGRDSVFEAVDEASGVTTSTVSYAGARAALARKERDSVLDRKQLSRSVRALDAQWRGFVRLPVSNLVACRAGEMAERYALRGFDAIHLASAARIQDRFPDLRFLASDDRLVDAARRASVPVYGEA